MRLELFKKNDQVLLVGEGNFSFAFCLVKHQLPINIVATCFESKITYQGQEKNIQYLKSQNVPVIFNVDATKLHESECLKLKQFSKIIFNFPHVGGKMKIHLNRELLKNFFISASYIVHDEGSIIVSLCNGQGGTLFDKPQRNWHDSWQATEMAAHAGFYLSAVEYFQRDNFQDYSCIGYRSQDVKFNINGALVHIFVRGKIPFAETTDIWDLYKNLNSSSLKNSSLSLLPLIYTEMYETTPLSNPNSAVCFFKNLIIKDLTVLPNLEVITLSDADVPISIKNNSGVIYTVSPNENSLRQSAYEILNIVLQMFIDDLKTKIVFFPGMYFNCNLGKIFLKDAPVRFEFLILGYNLGEWILNHFKNLIKIFKEDNINCIMQLDHLNTHTFKSDLSINYYKKLIYAKGGSVKMTPVVYLFLSYKEYNIEACIIDINTMCQYFFQLKSWKEIWAEDNKVIIDNFERPLLKQKLLFPLSYTFDITLRYITKKGFNEKILFETLWFAAGKLIESVELINVYNSNEEWSTNCYRITYKSLDKPINRDVALKIHSQFIGPLLELATGASIR